MENALLIGLSRQTALQRELDVVANNIANLNTTGFKADGAVFAEYLQPARSVEQFAAPDRRMSFVQDRMSWHDMSQGTIAADRRAARRRHRRRRHAGGADRARRALHPQRRAAAQQLGELVTTAGDKVMGDNGPIVLQATDRDIVITKDGTIKVREGTSLNSDSTRGKLRLVTLRQSAAVAEGRRLDLRRAGRRHAAAAAEAKRPCHAGRDREVERASGDRDDAHDRADARLHRGRHHPAAAKRHAKNSIQQLAEVPA